MNSIITFSGAKLLVWKATDDIDRYSVNTVPANSIIATPLSQYLSTVSDLNLNHRFSIQ